MSFRTKRMLLSLLIIAGINFIALSQLINTPGLGIMGVVGVVLGEVALVWATFKLAEAIIPKPPIGEMNFGEIMSSIWKSPIFWTGFLGLIFSIVQIVTGMEFTAEDAQYIIGLDWGDVVGSIMSIALMVMRKNNISKAAPAIDEG